MAEDVNALPPVTVKNLPPEEIDLLNYYEKFGKILRLQILERYLPNLNDLLNDVKRKTLFTIYTEACADKLHGSPGLLAAKIKGGTDYASDLRTIHSNIKKNHHPPIGLQIFNFCGARCEIHCRVYWIQVQFKFD